MAIAVPGARRSPGAGGWPGPPDYVPGEVIVGYRSRPVPAVTGDVATTQGTMAVASTVRAAPDPVLKLPPGESVTAAVARLRRKPGVAYAVPNYVAHAGGRAGSPTIPAGPTGARAGNRCSGTSSPPPA